MGCGASNASAYVAPDPEEAEAAAAALAAAKTAEAAEEARVRREVIFNRALSRMRDMLLQR